MRHTPHRTQIGSSENPRIESAQAHRMILDEEGVTAIEYALLASLIAMVALVSIMALGLTVQGMWQGVAKAVSDVMS